MAAAKKAAEKDKKPRRMVAAEKAEEKAREQSRQTVQSTWKRSNYV